MISFIFYFIFEDIMVGGFVNLLIKEGWPHYLNKAFNIAIHAVRTLRIRSMFVFDVTVRT